MYNNTNNKYQELMNLSYIVGNLLIKNNISLSACESCTGGLFSQMITNVPGISAVFDRGLVTYTEKAKIEELGVKQETLKAFTVYSKETAEEMAYGLWKKTKSSICVSITGIAGPNGEIEGKTVGTMYVGLCENGNCKVVKVNGSADRTDNRILGAMTMFKVIKESINKIVI